MGYEYDSKVNRDLARTAMSIYTKSHDIKPLNESAEVISEEVLRENVNALILNYVSDVIVLAESHLGREMTDAEINESSMEVLNRIDSISPDEKAEFIQQLAEAAGPGMAQADAMSSAPSIPGTPVAGRNGLGVAGKPQGSRRPGVSGRRPSGSDNQLGQGPGSPGTPVAGRPSGPGAGGPSVGGRPGARPGAGPGVVASRPGAGGPSVVAGPGGGQAPGTVGGRPGAGGPSVVAGPGGGQAPGSVAPGRPTTDGEFDPSNFSSIQDYLDSPDGFAANGGAGLAQVINMIQNQENQDGPGLGFG